MLGEIIGLVVIGFFIYGLHHDRILNRLEHKKLKDLTLNDLVYIVLALLLFLGFIKLFFDLFK